MEFKFIDGTTGSSDTFDYGPQTFYHGSGINAPDTLNADTSLVS